MEAFTSVFLRHVGTEPRSVEAVRVQRRGKPVLRLLARGGWQVRDRSFQESAVVETGQC